jgi:leucyl-tRNA synthetase
MKPWNTQGIEGIARFLRKVWRLVVAEDGDLQVKIGQSDALEAETERVLHATIKKVGQDYESLGFNTAISQMMICINHLAKAEALPREAVEDFVKLLAPLAPHLGEELWQRLGHQGSIAQAGWPEYDENKLVEESVKIIFQVNGKYRGDAQLPVGVSKDDAIAAAKANQRVQGFTEGKEIKKEIYVPGKIVNIVAV